MIDNRDAIDRGNRNLFSKKLAMGKSRMANKNPNINGSSTSLP
jgi:hypothetical protein